MGEIRGSREYKRFKAGEILTLRESVLAQCYICNGGERVDCQGKSCSLYRFFPYRSDRPQAIKKELTPAQRKSLVERLKKGKERKGGYLTPNQQEIGQI